MTKFYATNCAEDGSISINADIFAFETRADAEAYLRQGFDCNEWFVEIEAGNFGDCWIKCYSEPSEDNIDFSPFTLSECIVRAPGQHPGGHCWWVEPKAEIMVAVPRWIGE